LLLFTPAPDALRCKTDAAVSEVLRHMLAKGMLVFSGSVGNAARKDN
jgi:hypothetical protein